MRATKTGAMLSVVIAVTACCLPAEEKPSAKVQRLMRDLEAEIEGKGGKPIVPGGKPIGGEAADELAKLGPEAAPAVPLLIRAVREGEGLLRINAAYALGQVGKEAAGPLIELLSDDEREVRHQAAHALGLIGGDARPAIPSLLAMLESSDAGLRGTAAESLGRIGAERNDRNNRVVPALMKALKDEDSSVRASAAGALGRLRVEAEPAVAALLQILNDEDESTFVRDETAKALGRIGPATDDVIPALTRALDFEHPSIRSSAAHAFFLMGSKAEPAVPALIQVVKEPRKVPENLTGDEAYGAKLLNQTARTNAAFALGRMGAAAKSAIPVLERVAENDPDSEVRESAEMNLEKIRKEIRKR